MVKMVVTTEAKMMAKMMKMMMAKATMIRSHDVMIKNGMITAEEAFFKQLTFHSLFSVAC